MPERPSCRSYSKASRRLSLRANRPTLTLVTVEPNSGSPVWSMATGEAPPVSSTNMPRVPLASSAENATAPRLLIEGCSEFVNNELFGSVLRLKARLFPVKTARLPLLRNATSVTMPRALMTGSSNETPGSENAGLLGSATTVMIGAAVSSTLFV